jgi:hypothetical protein
MPVGIDLSPEDQEKFRRSHRWGAAAKAGLIAGAIVWLFPSGNPWTAFMSPSGAYIMGRPVSADQSITMMSAQALPAHAAHFVVSILFAMIILAVVWKLRSGKALFAGAATGLALYVINFAVFRAVAPQFTGAYEFNVALAHVLFGGIAAGCIRGFLRPPQMLDATQPNPGPRYMRNNP